jgi:hypothetical protein
MIKRPAMIAAMTPMALAGALAKETTHEQELKDTPR